MTHAGDVFAGMARKTGGRQQHPPQGIPSVRSKRRHCVPSEDTQACFCAF